MRAELYASLAAQAAHLARRDYSARELCHWHLERIAAVDGSLGAFLEVDSEGALAAADASDSARARGEALGPLSGIPIALKDSLVTEGVATTAGSKMLEGWIPPYSATAVRKLEEAGAVLLGKLNMDEFGMGSSSEASAFRPVRNPWDISRVAGGSSGGSAAAVAAGMCSASLGTDTGGSIRQPAALCGVVGIKPTYGRVSRQGVIAFASSLDQVGPLARTVEDAALVLQAIAGFDPEDATSIDERVPDYRAALAGGVSGLTIGIARELSGERAAPAVQHAFRAALSTLAELGARVVEISLPHTRYALPAYYVIAPAEASSNLSRYDGVRFGHRAAAAATLDEMYSRSRSEGFGPEVVRRILLGTFALRSEHRDAFYKKAQKARTLIRRDFESAFAKVDVIASPTAPTTAFALGAVSDPVDMYLADIFTLSCNLAGIPGLSLPCGFSPEGLPFGLQLLGPPLGESALFRVAAAYEGAAGLSQRHPELL